jgi:23S rRNA pseudouridine1911/1915/1917 synthase
VTHVRIAERYGHLATRLACALETGRTHQIRLHLSRNGHPILGDPRHGQRTAWDPPRLALHAARLGFRHPRTGSYLAFESPLPSDLREWLQELSAMSREGLTVSGAEDLALPLACPNPERSSFP